MLKALTSLFSPASLALRLGSAGREAVRSQLWPNEAEIGHPWALLYDDTTKKEIAAEAMQRVSVISGAADKIHANREWIIESVLLLAEFGSMVVKKRPDPGCDPIEGYPGVTGELEPHLDDLIAITNPKLLQAADAALSNGIARSSKLTDRNSMVRELLATRLNRGQFNLHVANVLRFELRDTCDIDWLMPFQYSLMTHFEDSHRKALGMGRVVTPVEALGHSLFMNVVHNGAPDPYAAWIEARAVLAHE